MAGAIAKLYATLGLDARGFDQGLAQSQGKVNSFVAGFGQQAKAGFGLGAGFSAGALAFNALSDAASMAADYVGDAIGMASDWEEANNKVGVVFGRLSDEIRDFASEASTSMGMSERTALEALGTFGNFAQALGVTEDAAVDLSRDMVQLAADMGSFNNVASEDVLIALRSGLSGEVEPLRRFGVALSAAAVDAELLAMGAQKVGGAWTEAQKVQARYNIIMRQTSKAQGDFLRTGDGLANSMKTINAQLEDAQTEIGKALLPVMRDLVVFIKNDVVPIILTLAKSLGDLGKAIGDFIDLGADLQRQTQDLGQTINDVVGRDIVNDFFNFGRIMTTGGAALVVDYMDDAQRAAQDLGKGLGILGDDFVSYEGEVERARNAMATLPEAFSAAADVVPEIQQTFSEARAAIVQGFGSIKAALSKESRPQLISRADRVENMEKRQRRIMKQLHKAVDADDPWNAQYWAKAAIKQQHQLDTMRGKSKTSTTDIRRKFEAMGVDIDGTWLSTRRNAVARAEEMKTGISAEIDGLKAHLDSLDFTATGAGWIAQLTAGFRGGIPALGAAVGLAAATARASATAGGTGGSTTVVNAGVIVADDKGIDKLGQRLDRRKNMRSRGPMRFQQTD